jgi:ferritin
MALEQEQRVTEEINELFRIARDSNDYAAEEFLMWFIKEQVEEVRSMNDLLNVCEQADGNVLLIEDFLTREKIGDEGQAEDTPPAAGGLL